MAVTVYKSSDGSAPVLTGQVGSLVALLDAVLVNGYGAKVAAGWAKSYAGTNTASYRMGVTGNTGFYLDVNDNGPGAGTAKEARAKGYEVMTAVATGTNPFPTTAQMVNGVFIRKSFTADATARAWTIIADTSCFYLFIESGDSTAPVQATCFAFGDIFSYKTADAYRCVLIGRTTENSATTASENLGTLNSVVSASLLTTTQPGHYLARSFTGLGSSHPAGKLSDNAKYTSTTSILPDAIGSTFAGVPALAYPNGPDNGLYMAPIWLAHNASLRGYLKGLWCPLHNKPLGHNDTFTGSGNLAGKTFLVQNIMHYNGTVNNATNHAQLFIETSDTWS